MNTTPPAQSNETSCGVPVRQLWLSADRSLPYVALSDMDQEVAERFTKDIAPCACPTVEDEQAFYLHDWERWNRSQNVAAST